MSKPVDIIITGADYEIAKMQLERLKLIAEQRLLTLEEAKIYDILVRNLKVSKNDPECIETDYSEKERLLLTKKDEDLKRIALGTIKLTTKDEDE